MGNEENASRNKIAQDFSEMRAKLAPRCKLKDLSFWVQKIVSHQS
jgi:hypothetical protein